MFLDSFANLEQVFDQYQGLQMIVLILVVLVGVTSPLPLQNGFPRLPTAATAPSRISQQSC